MTKQFSNGDQVVVTCDYFRAPWTKGGVGTVGDCIKLCGVPMFNVKIGEWVLPMSASEIALTEGVN